jgi:hypothetical protein
MTDADGTTERGRRRWVLPLVIGAVVLALGGGIGIGVALNGDDGKTEEVLSSSSTSSTSDPAIVDEGGSGNSGGGGGGTRSPGTVGGTTKSGGGSTTTKPPITTTPPTSPPAKASTAPEFTSTVVANVRCITGAPKGSVGNNPNLHVEWATVRATTVDISNARRPLGSYGPKGTSNITFHCGGYGVDRDPSSLTFTAYGAGGDTIKRVIFDVTDS